MNEDVKKEEIKNALMLAEPLHDIAVRVARVDAAPTLAEKAGCSGKCLPTPGTKHLVHCLHRWWRRLSKATLSRTRR